ncbi:MAG: hypothetical protein AAF604_06280 [Acidobacteriota bacterium]
MENSEIESLYESLKKLGIIKSPERIGQLWKVLNGYMAKKTVFYDMECIEDDSSYGELFIEFWKVFRDELRIRRFDIKSFLDTKNKRAGISVVIGEETLSSEWEQSADWVESGFLTFIKEQIEPRLGGRFVEFVTIDQGYRALYLPKEVADSADKLFRDLEEGQMW